MIKKSIMLAVVMVFGTGMFANAACTAEEAQAKGQEFVNAAMALAQSNPEQYGKVAEAMQKELPELQKINDIDALCKFYDEWSAKMK